MSTQNSCGCSSNSGLIGWLPPGASTVYNPNSTMTVQPPAGWTYLGIDNNGNYCMADAGTSLTVYCSCGAKDGSCLPMASGSNYGCEGTCSSCTMLASASVAGNQVTLVSGGFVNLSITPVIMNISSAPIPAGFQAMYGNQAVMTMFNNFLQSIYGTNPIPEPTYVNYNVVSAPTGYSYAFVNIAGRAFAQILPDSALAADCMGGGSASCDCNSDDDTDCNLMKHPTLGSLQCSGNCSASCSLTTGSNLANTFGVVGESVYYAISYVF